MSLFARWQTKSGDPETRKRAAAKLGAGGSRHSAGALVAMLTDDDWSVRVAAAEALGSIGSLEATGALVSAARAADQLPETAAAALRAAIVRSLQRFGSGAVPLLVAASSDKHQKTREVAVEALGGIGTAETLPTLKAALGDDRSAVRQAAARGLGRSKALEAVEALVTAVGHRDAATRRTIVEALGASGGDSRAALALGAAIADTNRTVREAAVRALGANRSRPAIEALLGAYQGPDRDLRELAAETLRELEWQPQDPRERAVSAILRGDFAGAAALGRPAVEPLVAALTARDVATRRLVAGALGLTRDARAARALAGALRDHDDTVRSAASQALAQLGAPAAVPVIDLLDDQSPVVHQAAIGVLVEMDVSTTIGYLLWNMPGIDFARDTRARLVVVPDVAALDQARLVVATIECFLRHLAGRVDAKALRDVASFCDFGRLSEAAMAGRDPSLSIEERVSMAEPRRLAAAELRRRNLEVPVGAD